MNIHALDIPENANQLHGWLERHLVGLDLASLAAELDVVHADKTGHGPSLDDVLGERRETVLEAGLSDLPETALTHLLVHPRLLLQLQAEVVVGGGAYWDALAEEEKAAVEAVVSRGRDRLGDFLAGNQPSSQATTRRIAADRQSAWYLRPAVVSIATAACVLLGVFLFDRFAAIPPDDNGDQIVAAPPAASGWGWSKPDALPQNVTAEQYLQQLADGAGAWFKKRPTDRAALAKRIGEFRQGCSIVMLADHRSLPDEDRQWLIEKCRLWAGKLDRHLADVESPGVDFQTARDAADTTINKLIAALNLRANQVVSG